MELDQDSKSSAHRFTLSDYFSLGDGTLQSLRETDTSPSGQPLTSRPNRSKTKPTPPTIVTTSPIHPSQPPTRRDPFTPASQSTNSLALDLYSNASRSSLTPSPEPLGDMVHPLGPGPQPYPSSPDGHSDAEDNVGIDLTYPPRGPYGAKSPSFSTPPRPSAAQRTVSGDRAPTVGPAVNATRVPNDPRPFGPPDGLTSPRSTSPRIISPGPSAQSVARTLEQLARSSPFADEKSPAEEKPAVLSSSTINTRNLQNSHPSKQESTLHQWFPKSWLCRLLLLVVLLEAVIDIAIQTNILFRFNLEMEDTPAYDRDQNQKRLPVYLYIFATAHVFQLALTIWAIRTRNTILVIGLAIFNALFLIYAGIEIEEVRTILGTTLASDSEIKHDLLTLPLNVLTAVSIAIIAASEAAVVILTYFIWREFGWDIYRSLGADLRIRRCYFQYQVFECLICFSFFFFAGFGVQFAVLVLNRGDPEYILTWVMFPLLLLWLLMGLAAARFEWVILMATFLVGLLAGTAYFIFKMVRIWTQPEVYSMVQKSLSAFAVLSLIMIILTLVYGTLVWRNFGRGLRASLDTRRKTRKQKRSQRTEQHALSPTGDQPVAYPVNRLTID